MAITIQELLASDTISQVVDKINFNFDQLLLNGGGPVGPAGASGPTGPIGGRGERGTEWYEGTDDPNVTAPTPTPLKADYYLQSNGDVWEYTGLTWNNTGINLTGPTGSAGASAGWSFFGNDGSGNYFATAKNTSYPSLIPAGSQSININNEGVSTAAFGIAGPNDNGYPGIPLTTAFQLTTAMAGSLDSSTVTMLVHQKDSSASAIKFMGGGSIGADKYEQDSLTSLSSIKLGVDDSLVIDVPKTITGTIGSVSDTYGFNVYTINKAQNYRAGRSIEFKTGTLGNVLSGAYDVSDFNIEINPVNSTILPKFSVQVLGTDNASFEVGGNITFPTTTPSAGGRVLIDGSSIRVRGSSTIRFNSAITDYQFVNLNSSTGTPVGLVGYTATGSLTSLSASGGTFPDGVISNAGGTLSGSTGLDNRITRWNGTRNLQSSDWSIDDDGNLLPVTGDANIGSDDYRIDKIYADNQSGIKFGNNTAGDKFEILIDNTSQYAARFSNRTGSTSGIQFEIGLGVSQSYDLSTSENAKIILGEGYISTNGGRAFPGIEFLGNDSTSNYTDSDNSHGDMPHGIYMRAGLPGDGWKENILKIKGGDGGGTTTSFQKNMGKAVHIVGGDASEYGVGYNSGGGSVIIAGGGRNANQIPSTSTVNGPSYVWLGYNPTYDTTGSSTEESALRRSSQGIRIGPTTSLNPGLAWDEPRLNADIGYVAIQQPPTGMFTNVTAAEDYTLSIRSNRTDQSHAGGGVAIQSYDGDHGIDFQTNVGGAAYWTRTEAGDNVIIHRNNGNSGDAAGALNICAKDVSNLGIRIDPRGGPENVEQIQFFGQRTENPSDVDEVAFRFNGRQSVMLHNTAKTSDRYAETIVSGAMYPVRLGGGNLNGSGTSNAGILNWLRIGNIVQVSGIVNFGSGGSQRIIALPLKGSSGTSNVQGCGVGWDGNNDPLEVHAAGTDGWSVKNNGAWYTPANGSIRVSFSYHLQ